jgi:hypothetical protein
MAKDCPQQKPYGGPCQWNIPPYRQNSWMMVHQYSIVASFTIMARRLLRISSLKEGAMCSVAKIQKLQNLGITEIAKRYPLLGNISVKHISAATNTSTAIGGCIAWAVPNERM